MKKIFATEGTEYTEGKVCF